MRTGPPVGRSNRPAVLVLLSAAFIVMITLSIGSASAVADNRTTNVTVYRAPDVQLNNAEAVAAAIENDTIQPTDRVVVGETLLVVIDSPRLAETMANGTGSTTKRFFDALAGKATFRIMQTNPTAEVPPLIAQVGKANVTVYRDETTTYALVDTGALAFRYLGNEDSERAQIHGGERFAVEFGYDLAVVGQSAGPIVEFQPTQAEFVTFLGHWYDPLPPDWVKLTVEVNIEPDDSLLVRAHLDDGQTVTVPVDPDDVPGLDRVWLDLRNVDPGTDYALEVIHDGEVVDRYHGTVREPQATITNATLTRVENQTAVNATVRLSHGGKVRVFDETCEKVGTAWVEPSGATRLSIRLWNERGGKIQVEPQEEYGVLIRALRDRGDNETVYPGPTAEATIGFDGGTCRTPTPAATPSSPKPTTVAPPSTATLTESGLDDTTSEPSTGQSWETTTSPSGQPGFAALAALAVLFALVFRQRLRR